jgi:predicted sugar kinase
VGTERDVSLALMPLWQPFGGRLFAGVGAALNERRVQLVDAPDSRETRVHAVAIAGIRLPIAGEGLAIELTGRADQHDKTAMSALFGVRVRFGATRNLQFGEPTRPALAARAAVWNDVLMQLILLQQNLESFTRIKEIQTGIELEFDMGSLTLWDDVARVGRVLAAAQPPVTVTTFGPNAGRVAAAVTAGSFPPERLKLQRADRVYLRVEH